MTEPPLTYAARIRAYGKERAHDIAYVHVGIDGSERSVDWAWLDRRSGELAGALAARGLAEAGRLALAVRNSPEFVAAAFAAWKLGAVPVPVRWDIPAWELERLRETIDPQVWLGAGDLDWVAATDGNPVPDLPEVVSPHLQGICSSGSTGTPKIILSRNPAVYNEVFATPMVYAWTTENIPRPQRILVNAPMYHVNAFATINNLLAGDLLVVLEKFDAAQAVSAIEQHRVTTFTATPTMLQKIADLPGVDARDLSSLAWILQGAAPMPPSLVHRWAGLIGAEKIVMAYGMTEGIGLTALRGDEYLAHEGSVGKGFRGTEVAVLDDDGKHLPAGEIGEIFLRSQAYQGSIYLGAAPQMKTADGGWTTVGDMGYLDDEGYLYLVDRRVDLIVTGGANVFPAEVEKALIDHPGIADVVVIGLKDEKWGRRVHAVVEPADPAAPPAAEDVIAYARARLAAYKLPKTVEIVDAIPRSEATKVNRGRMVEARGG